MAARARPQVDLGGRGEQAGDVMDGGARSEVVAVPGDGEDRDADGGEVDDVAAEGEAARGELVDAEEAVVELAHRPARVGVHARDEAVDGLELREEVAIVEVGGHRQRSGELLVERGEAEHAPHERRRRAPENPVDRRADGAVGEARERAQRRHDPHAREVERARDHGQGLGGEVGIGGEREGRHDPAQAPADELHRRAPGVLADAADRRRQDAADPVLEAELAIGEADRAVVELVGGVAEREQVLGQRAPPTQVEAARRRGERRHEQDRELARPDSIVRAQVAEHRPLRRLVDDPRRRRTQIGHAAAEQRVVGVRRHGGGIGQARTGRREHSLRRLGAGSPGQGSRPARSGSRATSSARAGSRASASRSSARAASRLDVLDAQRTEARHHARP